jgi:hypothetical protein
MQKFYTEKENRDPNVYLGIDKSMIPFEYFKGIYLNMPGTVFGSDLYGDETQFYVGEDGVSIATINDDEYVTKEDLKNDLWFLINHVYVPEYTTQFSDYSTFKDDRQERVINRYYNGESGKITEDEKIFNGLGQYMRKIVTLDTLAGADIRERLYNISSFLYATRPDLPWMERQVKLRINSVQERELYNLIFNSAMVEFLKIGGQEVTENMKFQKMILPSIGTVYIEIDDSLEDFILEKID